MGGAGGGPCGTAIPHLTFQLHAWECMCQTETWPDVKGICGSRLRWSVASGRAVARRGRGLRYLCAYLLAWGWELVGCAWLAVSWEVHGCAVVAVAVSVECFWREGCFEVLSFLWCGWGLPVSSAQCGMVCLSLWSVSAPECSEGPPHRLRPTTAAAREILLSASN